MYEFMTIRHALWLLGLIIECVYIGKAIEAKCVPGLFVISAFASYFGMSFLFR